MQMDLRLNNFNEEIIKSLSNKIIHAKKILIIGLDILFNIIRNLIITITK